MKNVFGGLISRQGMIGERISNFENMIIETSKTEKAKKKKRLKKNPNQTEYPKTVEHLQKM